jgi:kynurenine formamidase
MANVTYYSFSSHFGTHIDAPRHYFADRESLDQLPIARFRGRGFVVPLEGRRECEITPEHLAPFRDEIARAPFVLLSSRWADHFGADEYRRHPYLGTAAAELLVEFGATCVILDVMTPDLPLSVNPDRNDSPVHRILLGNGVLIVENAASMRAIEGMHVDVLAFPIAIEEADGAPVRLVVEAG